MRGVARVWRMIDTLGPLGVVLAGESLMLRYSDAIAISAERPDAREQIGCVSPGASKGRLSWLKARICKSGGPKRLTQVNETGSEQY